MLVSWSAVTLDVKMHLWYTNLNWLSYSVAQSQIAVNVISSNNIYTLSN